MWLIFFFFFRPLPQAEIRYSFFIFLPPTLGFRDRQQLILHASLPLDFNSYPTWLWVAFEYASGSSHLLNVWERFLSASLSRQHFLLEFRDLRLLGCVCQSNEFLPAGCRHRFFQLSLLACVWRGCSCRRYESVRARRGRPVWSVGWTKKKKREIGECGNIAWINKKTTKEKSSSTTAKPVAVHSLTPLSSHFPPSSNSPCATTSARCSLCRDSRWHWRLV